MQISNVTRAGGAKSLIKTLQKESEAQQSTLEQPQEASLSISDESRKKYEKERQEKELAQYGERLQEQMQEQKEAADREAEAFEDMGKLMEIARRIANGDRVPAEDEKKLMEFNADLYQAAKAAAIVNADKKHKDYDSMFEEEEESDKREKLRDLNKEAKTSKPQSAETTGMEEAESNETVNKQGL